MKKLALMKKAVHGQLPAPAPAPESPCVDTLLYFQSLQSLSREINPNANHEKSTTKAVQSYSSTAAGFQFTLQPGRRALLEGVFFASLAQDRYLAGVRLSLTTYRRHFGHRDARKLWTPALG